MVPEKPRKQRLVFDTHRVNQHFLRLTGIVRCPLRRPGQDCNSQLTSAYHMAQTDVNTAFYRILALLGMSEYLILPSVSHSVAPARRRQCSRTLATLARCFNATPGSRDGFFLGSLLLSEDGGKLLSGLLASRQTPCLWIVTAHLQRREIRFISGCYVDGVCAVGWGL